MSVDVLDFVKKDKLDNAPKPKEEKKPRVYANFLKLTDKRNLDHTLVYKPIKDAKGVPYRRIHSAMEFHIKTHDDAGNYKFRTYEIFEDPSNYGPLTDKERELFEEVKSNIYQINDMKDSKSAWMKVSKFLTIFYAYSYSFINSDNKNELENPVLSLVTHSSSKLLENFHKACETKNAVYCTESWLRDYYSLESPGKTFVVKTSKAEKSFGFDVTVDFLELPADALKVSVDDLKKAQESTRDLDEVRFKAKFDPAYFEEILKVCKNWFAERANSVTETPVDSELDNVKTEMESQSEMKTSDVPPLGSNSEDIQPPDPNIQMRG